MTDKARELSVNNLQRLYAFVMSLAIAESLRRVLAGYVDVGRLPAFASLAAVFSLLVTAIPYFHGANRYLESAYITGEKGLNFRTLMVDFVALFIEGLFFFVLALVIDQTRVFVTGLAALFIFGSAWIGVRFLTAPRQNRPLVFVSWPIANVVAAACLLVFAWSGLLQNSHWPWSTAVGLAVAVIALARTVYDYYSAWEFYVPPSEGARAQSSPRTQKAKR